MDYLGKRNGTLCNKDIILSEFENIKEYQDLVNIEIKESKESKDKFRIWI